MPIRCEIVTQDRALYEGQVDIVVAPGSEGELGILPNHAPLLTTLGLGVLRVRFGDQEEAFAIAGGILEVRPDVVTVLADVGENVSEIDVERAEAAKARAEEYLLKGPPPDTDEYLRMQASLRRSQLRLDAVRRFRHRQKPQTRASTEEGS
ncbi:MAG: ATP synthase F1 subunit epsilon [Anaerolineales bacterium]|nr:MAG: ATP synthase F1 subunit epsilon [Anaerolineales bacterium]